MELSSLATLHLSLLPEPFFPTALEHENIFELRFSAQATSDFAAGIATLAAVDYDPFLGRPFFQKLREQFVPAILVQQDRARDMVTREFFVRPRVDPDRVLAPGACLRESYHFGSRDGRLPRDFVAIINRLADSR